MTTVNTTAPALPSTPDQDCDPLLDSAAAKVIKTVAYSTLLLLSLVGNSVVPAVVYRNPELHTSINYIIASMSVSDVFVAIFALPERIKQIYVPQAIWQIDGVLGSILCKSRAFIIDISGIVTVLSLVIISVERFFATVFPMKTQPIRSKKSCFIVVAFTWIFAMLYSSQNFYTWRLETGNRTTYCVYSWEPAFNTDEVDKIEYTVVQVFFIIIPFVVIASLYCAIIVSLQRKKTPGHLESNQRRKIEKKYRRVTYMLLTVVVVYLVPVIAGNVYLFRSLFVWASFRPCSNRHTTFFLVYLTFVGQAFNPYIYCMYISYYKKGFRQVLCCFCDLACCKYCKNTEQDMAEEIPLNIDCHEEPCSNPSVALVGMRKIEIE